MKTAALNLCIAVVSLFVAAGLAVAALEGVLRTGALQSGGVPWVTPDGAALDAKIDKVNGALAALHPYAFTDLIHAGLGSNDSGYRVAVLSDSFVWGDGLNLGQPWPHKLQRKLNAMGTDVTVQSWGINGWSTRDHLTFLKAVKRDEGSLNVDEVLIGFVTNDPDLGDIVQRQAPQIQIPPRAFMSLFPWADAFLTAQLQAVYESVLDPGAGYGAWEAKLWTDENLESYREVLSELKTFSVENGLPITFVLTPHNPNKSYFEPRYEALKSLLRDVGIPVIDLLPSVVEQLSESGTPPLYRELWANPGDGHPGDLLTDIYAQDVAGILMSRQIETIDTDVVSPSLPEQICTGGEIVVVVPQPVRFDFGPDSYVRLVGRVSASAGAVDALASHAIVQWPDGEAIAYHRNVLAGESPRDYDRVNSTKTEPASKFWADVPGDTDLSDLSLYVKTAAGCTYVAPLSVQTPPIDLMEDL
ncbi:MAG: hypothetical protein P8L66_01760 [Rhodospirillaceae bacterium]|nr:hypothetical protein [Rhodospirillaceae bacterium]